MYISLIPTVCFSVGDYNYYFKLNIMTWGVSRIKNDLMGPPRREYLPEGNSVLTLCLRAYLIHFELHVILSCACKNLGL